MLLVLTGKTASGKDTIKNALLEKFPHLKKVVTTTSRPPRDGETNGMDYHFVTRAEFEKKIESGEFAEHVEYGGNLYGTERKELEQALNQDLIWKIDPSRAGKIRQLIKRELLVIYIYTADDVILKRLKERGLSEEEIKKRMADDKKIWLKYKNNYDFVVENVPGKLDQTINEIVNIIRTSRFAREP